MSNHIRAPGRSVRIRNRDGSETIVKVLSIGPGLTCDLEVTGEPGVTSEDYEERELRRRADKRLQPLLFEAAA